MKDAGLVLRWHVAGPASPIIIDPRIVWNADCEKEPDLDHRGRYDAGKAMGISPKTLESKKQEVRETLKFEGVRGGRRKSRVLH